jgi:hypothetical protein
LFPESLLSCAESFPGKIRKTGGKRRCFESVAALAVLKKARNSLKSLALSVRSHEAANLHEVEVSKFSSGQ